MDNEKEAGKMLQFLFDVFETANAEKKSVDDVMYDFSMRETLRDLENFGTLKTA